MSNTNDDTNMTGNADNCDPLRTKSGHGLTSMIELGLEPVPITKRPTPETDAALCISHHPNDLLGWPEGRKAEFGGEHIVPARVCRDLERQLAEVTSQRDAAHQKCREYRLVALGAEDALEKMTAQRDEAEKRAAIAESDAAKHKLANDVLHQDGERWRELSCLFARQRDALVEAVKFVLEDSEIPSGHFWPDVLRKCREALAAVKETEG